jgi:aspartate/methionine/tyrosine aminotransferase
MPVEARPPINIGQSGRNVTIRRQFVQQTAKAALSAVLPSSRRGQISPFVVMDVMRAANDRAAEGHDIIHMEVGQPGTPAPRVVREAVKAAVDRELLGYTEALGIPALRERIALHYRQSYGVEVSPAEVIVTAGSSAGFVLAFLALLDEGARLLMAEPGYPCYRNIARAFGIAPVALPVGPAERWMPSAAALTAYAAREGKPDALLFASPANPTGTALSNDALADVCAWCGREGVITISDEIYHGLAFDAPLQTARAYNRNAVVINSFSKYYSMTGWRVGWMVVPPELVRPIERLAQNLYISPAAISQVGALAAFDAVDELEANKAVYAANRDLLLNELPGAGFTSLAPADGAFYLYADVSHLTDDSQDFAQRMLREAGVAATPGVDFDPVRGARFMRFSYAGTTAAMAEAAKRLRTWLG